MSRSYESRISRSETGGNRVRSKKLFKYIALLTTTVVMLTVLLPACAQEPEPQAINWNWNDAGPEKSTTGDWTKFFINEVNKASNGQMELNIFWMGSLFKGSAYLRSAKDGLFPIGVLLPNQAAADIPELQLEGLPMLMAKPEDAGKVLAKTRPIIDKVLLEKWNSVVLAAFPLPPQEGWTKQPIPSLADLQGIKLRAGTAEQGEWIKAIGAVPVPITFPEMFTALERGTIDGMITGSSLMSTMKFYEVVKYRVLPESWTIIMYITATKNYWDQLHESQQKILLDAGKKTYDNAMDRMRRGYLTSEEMEDILAHGAQWEPMLSEADLKVMQEKAVPIWESWAAKNGPVAQELLKIARETLKR